MLEFHVHVRKLSTLFVGNRLLVGNRRSMQFSAWDPTSAIFTDPTPGGTFAASNPVRRFPSTRSTMTSATAATSATNRRRAPAALTRSSIVASSRRLTLRWFGRMCVSLFVMKVGLDEREVGRIIKKFTYRLRAQTSYLFFTSSIAYDITIFISW